MTHHKPRVIFFPFGLLSHYLRCLELAASLREDYEVIFVHSSDYQSFVRQAGFPSVPALELSADQVIPAVNAFRFDWLNEPDLEAVLRSQIDLLRQWRPAFVVGDMSHTLKMAAAVTGTPYVSILNGYLSAYYALPRPFPTQHPLRHSGLPLWLLETCAPLGESLKMRQIHQPFRRLRRRYGLPATQTYREELCGDLTCLVDHEALFPQKNLPAHHRVIGPLYYAGREPDPALFHWLDTQKPTLVLSMGSTGAPQQFRCLADPDFADFNVVVAGDRPERWPARQHLWVTPFVNLPALLPQTAVVLCHGGNGTIYQALAAGVPVLCRPEFFEQEWNARRIAQLGYGQLLPPDTTRQQLRGWLEHWKSAKRDPRFAQLASAVQVQDSVQRFRQEIARFFGPAFRAAPAPTEFDRQMA